MSSSMMNAKSRKGIDVIRKVVACLLAAFLFYTFFTGLTLYEEAPFLSETSNRQGLFGLSVSTILCLLLFLYLLYQIFKKINDKTLRIIQIVIMVGMITMQFIFLFYYRSLYLWDGAFITGGANSLLETGKVADEAYYYLSVYPNQNGFVVLTMLLLKVGKLFALSDANVILLLNVFNTLCIDVGLVFTWLIIKRIYINMPQDRQTFLLMLLALNPFCYINVSYYYTMTLAMPFFMGGLYFSILLSGQKKGLANQLCHALAAGIWFGIGYNLRATTIIPVIAVFMVSLLFSIADKNIGKWMTKIALLLAVTILCSACLTRIEKCIVGIDTTETAFPATHWIMMSLTSPGSHNEADELYTAGFSTKDEKKIAVKERMREKLQELGLRGYVGLAGDKIRNVWSDGTHGYPFFLKNCLRTDGIYPYVFGEYRDVTVLYTQGYHLLLLLAMLVACGSLFRGNDNRLLFLMSLVMLGAFLFYLLWETSPQYSLPFVPVMMIVSAVGFSEMSASERERKKKYFSMCDVCVGAVLLFLIIFTLKNKADFTEDIYDRTEIAAVQLLANEPISVGHEGALLQTFKTSKRFNRLVFQWRNDKGEENDSVYQVNLLSNMQDKPLWTDEIVAAGQPYNGAFIKEFPIVEPGKGEIFTIEIKKVTGRKKNNLSFVTYTMGGYDSYPFGECIINGQSEKRDLLFEVSEHKTSPYTSAKTYLFIMSIFFVVFLFLEICCKLYGMKLLRNYPK